LRYFWLSFKAIFVKDIVVELRAKQVLPTMLVLGALIVYVLRLVSEAAESEAATVACGALWIALLFCGLLAQERSFATERQHGCMDGLLLAPIDSGPIYLSKLLVNVVILCVFELVIVPVVLMAFQLSMPNNWPMLLLVLLLGNIGISSIGTLFSAVVQLSRMRGSLLSIIVLVLLMPMMIPATFALLVLFDVVPSNIEGTSTLSFVGNLNVAIGYIISFDAVFTVVSWLLFGFVTKE